MSAREGSAANRPRYRKWRRRRRKITAMPFYWISLVIPGAVARRMPKPVREFMWRRCIRAI